VKAFWILETPWIGTRRVGEGHDRAEMVKDGSPESAAHDLAESCWSDHLVYRQSSYWNEQLGSHDFDFSLEEGSTVSYLDG